MRDKNFHLVYSGWVNKVSPGLKDYSAFTVAELGKMLPDGFRSYFYSDRDRWYCNSNTVQRNKQLLLKEDNTEANARAKMVVYLKEKGLI